MSEISELIKLIQTTESYRKHWGYNPHDNYAWREIMSFEYMKAFFPSMKKARGRYGADGNCSELNLNWLEHKSVNASLRKTTKTYNFDRIYFEFDVSESRFRHSNEVDGYLFALYDRDSSNHPYPVHVLFSHGKKLLDLKKEINNEREKFFSDAVRKRDTIELYYPVLHKYSDVYTDQVFCEQKHTYEPRATLEIDGVLL